MISNLDIIKQGGVINMASLYKAMRQGEIYLSVQTVDFPNGEIRGQIFAD